MSQDCEMPDREPLSIDTSGFLSPNPRSIRGISPPKTPVPTLPMEGPYSQHPDWSMVPAAEDYISRPTSAMSNSSDSSDDSFYSGSRVSHQSEDGSCTSPESDLSDPFQFPSFSKGKGKALYSNEHEPDFAPSTKQARSKTRVDAPWTKEQSAHVWATYHLYLQDPTVTPFRMGHSSVPPHGVVHRVARVAKRSWKGPKAASAIARRSARLTTPEPYTHEGRSITPTRDVPAVYAQWPHSSSATRFHLRELCRANDEAPARHSRHFQSRSQTPFTREHRPPKPAEARRSTSFTTGDMSLSLTTGTAESMQPDGPLARLTAAAQPPSTSFGANPPSEPFNKPTSFGKSRGHALTLEDETRNNGSSSRVVHTYGPSSSQSLDIFGHRSSATRSDHATRPTLRSPVHFNEPRSLNNTQKRRAQHSLEEEFSPNGAVLRPSILNEQLFGAPFPDNQRRVRSRGFSLGGDPSRHYPGESLMYQAPEQFPMPPVAPSSHAAPQFVEPNYAAGPSHFNSAPQFGPSATFDPPRLGSPFSESGLNQTFPRRLFSDATSTIRRPAFATVHQTRRSIESFDFGGGPSLQSRLTNLDEKLKEIRGHEAAARQNPQ